MLPVSIGVLRNHSITRRKPTSSRPGRQRRQERLTRHRAMPAVIPTTPLLQRLHMDRLRIQHTRVHPLLRHQGLSQRIHTRLTSSLLEERLTHSHPIRLTRPVQPRIHTDARQPPPQARMPPQVPHLRQVTTLRPMVANTLYRNNHNLREIPSRDHQNDISRTVLFDFMYPKESITVGITPRFRVIMLSGDTLHLVPGPKAWSLAGLSL